MKKIFINSVILVIFGLSSTFAQYTKLLDFTGTNGDAPYGSLVFKSGYLYGMTDGYAVGCGNVFRIKTDGSGFENLYSFANSPDGCGPYNSLIFIGDTLYGMTAAGGNSTFYGGTIFKIRPDGNGYATLLTFDSLTGYNPYSNLFYDGTYLYGTTVDGGLLNYGTIFKIKPDSTGFSVIHNFSVAPEANVAYGSLISDGTYLYGMSYMGGPTANGTIYKILPDGNGYTMILDFAGQPDGSNPWGDMIYDGTYLYGMTAFGGTNNLGTVFKIKPDGSNYLKLLDFDGPNGRFPFGGLFYDGTFLFGMTNQGGSDTTCTYGCGVIFKIKPDGSEYAKLYDFDTANGSAPFASLISDGNYLYGMTNSGGIDGYGAVFKIGGVLTGTDEIRENNSIAVYPNPAGDQVTIHTLSFSNKAVTVLVMNALGETMQEEKLKWNDDEIINIKKLPAGMYFLQMKTESSSVMKKFIKE